LAGLLPRLRGFAFAQLDGVVATEDALEGVVATEDALEGLARRSARSRARWLPDRGFRYAPRDALSALCVILVPAVGRGSAILRLVGL
jgi:hypothetical protein